MLRRTLGRLGGGHGDLFPNFKDGNLRPKWVLSRTPAKAPPKGKRYVTVVEPQKEHSTYKHHSKAAITRKKLVDLPKDERTAATIASVSASMHHGVAKSGAITAKNLEDFKRSEHDMMNRDWMAHKVPYPQDPALKTGDTEFCNKFFESWVLDHRCLLNDNRLGIQPQKMPWSP